MNKFVQFSIATFATSLLISCAGPSSNTTGWAINDKKNGGLQANLGYQGQEVGPGLVFVEGGTFMMGQMEEDFIKDWKHSSGRGYNGILEGFLSRLVSRSLKDCV